MNDFLGIQTLSLIEEKEKSWIQFKSNTTRENRLLDLKKLIDYLEDYSLIKIIIFCNFDHLDSSLVSVDEFREWEKVFQQLNRLPIVTVALIDGVCSGVNLQLAMTCDFRIAEADSILQATEVKQGYLPGMIILQLAKFVGLGIAKRILFMGLPYKVEDAFKVGLIDKIIFPDEKEASIEWFINSLLPVQPIAVQMARRLLEESFAHSYDETIGHFIAAQHKCIRSNNPD